MASECHTSLVAISNHILQSCTQSLADVVYTLLLFHRDFITVGLDGRQLVESLGVTIGQEDSVAKLVAFYRVPPQHTSCLNLRHARGSWGQAGHNTYKLQYVTGVAIYDCSALYYMSECLLAYCEHTIAFTVVCIWWKRTKQQQQKKNKNWNIKNCFW